MEPSGHESGSLISRVGWASFLPSDLSVSLTGLSGAQGDPQKLIDCNSATSGQCTFLA